MGKKVGKHFDLMTEAGEKIKNSTEVWQEYPRPQLRRKKWCSLNGIWELEGKSVRVPFPPESMLSEYGGELKENMTYVKHFRWPQADSDKRTILHFGAVDQIAEVYLNGAFLGRHEGGYFPFYFDITECFAAVGENCLEVKITDTLDRDFPYGKQRKDRGGMWYTPTSGIWQSVWLEQVPEVYVEKLKITPDMKGFELAFIMHDAQSDFADKNVDIVVVATPNDSHKELVISALEAGKTVVCEKPVEMTVVAFDEMAEASARTGSLFTVHQNRRWDVDFLGIKKIIEEGKLGKTLNIESRIHGSRGIPSDWRCKKAYGGGMILDWGVHLIDQMLQLNKSGVKNVYCTTTFYTKSECDDGFKLEINFNDGMRGYVEVGTLNFIALPRFYMQCDNGTAIINDWTENAKLARCKAWNEKDVIPVQTAAGITKTMAPRDEITLEMTEQERPKSDVHDFYRNLVKAIDGSEEIIVKLPEVRAVLRVMEAAFESAEKGIRIEL